MNKAGAGKSLPDTLVLLEPSLKCLHGRGWVMGPAQGVVASEV